MVQDISEDEIKALGMNSSKERKKIFQTVEDNLFLIDFFDIISVLSDPKIKLFDGQEIYFFKNIVETNEMSIFSVLIVFSVFCFFS